MYFGTISVLEHSFMYFNTLPLQCLTRYRRMYHLPTPVLCSVPLCGAAEKGLWLITILKPGSAGLEYLHQVNVETGFAVLSWYISADVVGGKKINHSAITVLCCFFDL